MTDDKLLSKPLSYLLFGLTGALFLFCCLTGRDLASEGNIMWTGGYALKTLGLSLFAGGALGSLVCLFFRSGFSAKVRIGGFWGRAGEGSGKGAWIGFLLIFLSWLPGFLAYYPAICAYDMPVQLGQITEHFYIDHHPIAHTLLIRGFMGLGEDILGSVNAGIAAFALLQMLFLASAFSFGLYCMGKRGVKRIWLLAVLLFCMLYPFHIYMSISITKDIMFTAFFVYQLLALAGLLSAGRETEKGKFIKMGAVFFVSSVGMILFRNNGKYAFAFYLFIVLLMCVFGKRRRRFWGVLLAVSAGTFLAGNLALSLFYRAVDGSQGDKREMLSIPIQQLARAMVYHGGIGVLPEDDATMGDADKALINDFILNEAYRKYRPDFADPVKSNTNTYVVRYRTGEFLDSYFRLLAAYPGDFINAVLAVDAGYLYPGDESHAWVNAQEGQAAGGGYVQTRWEERTLGAAGIHKDSLWTGLYEKMEKWASGNRYLEYPVLKYLFVPGVWIWLYLLLLGWLVLHGRFAGCLPISLALGYYLTLLFGPTVQLRYLYPVMAVFPFLLAAGTCRKGRAAAEGGNTGMMSVEG